MPFTRITTPSAAAVQIIQIDSMRFIHPECHQAVVRTHTRPAAHIGKIDARSAADPVVCDDCAQNTGETLGDATDDFSI